MAKYSVTCSGCDVEFKALFKPTPGRPITCGFCTIKHTDLSNIEYFSDLKVFLKSKFGNINITIARARKSIYNVLIEEKGKKPKRICSIELTAKSKDMTPVPNESKLPPFAGVIAEIKARDEKILELLEEFVKQYKHKEVSSSFV
jgi:formylmethanofuran dehydrogenase subunit D